MTIQEIATQDAQQRASSRLQPGCATPDEVEGITSTEFTINFIATWREGLNSHAGEFPFTVENQEAYKRAYCDEYRKQYDAYFGGGY